MSRMNLHSSGNGNHAKSIIVNLLPVALEESTHQEQERTLRLMELVTSIFTILY